MAYGKQLLESSQVLARCRTTRKSAASLLLEAKDTHTEV